MERLIYEFVNLFTLLLLQINLIYTSINLCLYYASRARLLQPCLCCPDFPPFNPFLCPLGEAQPELLRTPGAGGWI